ncbi:MAG TPA: hypothetical protein VMB79_14070 [Jatrophihabitans sp.]|nr:hypothetical protein [Jatrophihabitans sp.]
MNRKLASFAVASVAIAATLLGENVASASPGHSRTVPSVPKQWAALAASSTPKQVILDSATGNVISIKATSSRPQRR